MTNLLKRIYRAWLEFKYRSQDEDVCCCGGYVSQGGYGCPASCVSMKDYVIERELARRFAKGRTNDR